LIFDTTSVETINLIKERFPQARLILILPASFKDLERLKDRDIEDLFRRRIKKRNEMTQKERNTRIRENIENIKEFPGLKTDAVIVNDSLKKLKTNYDSFKKTMLSLAKPMEMFKVEEVEQQMGDLPDKLQIYYPSETGEAGKPLWQKFDKSVPGATHYLTQLIRNGKIKAYQVDTDEKIQFIATEVDEEVTRILTDSPDSITLPILYQLLMTPDYLWDSLRMAKLEELSGRERLISKARFIYHQILIKRGLLEFIRRAWRKELSSPRRLISPTSFGQGFGYDIRSRSIFTEKYNKVKADEPWLTPAMAYLIGKALGGVFGDLDQMRETRRIRALAEGDPRASEIPIRIRALVTADHRISNVPIREALIEGLRSAGVDVDFSYELVPTGCLNWYVLEENYDIAVQVSGSHNPYDASGLKIAVRQTQERKPTLHIIEGILTDLSAFYQEQLMDLYHNIKQNKLLTAKELGEKREIKGVVDNYIERLIAIGEKINLNLKGRNIMVDSHHGLGNYLTPVLRYFGANVVELYPTPDGLFPKGPADPTKRSSTKELSEKVKELNSHLKPGQKAYIGISLDGDGDRSGECDEEGEIIPPDRVLIPLYTRFILSNLDAIEKLNKIGVRVPLALDIRSSAIIKDIIKKYDKDGVIGLWITVRYPYHSDAVRGWI
jgi:phosphomannomutase